MKEATKVDIKKYRSPLESLMAPDRAKLYAVEQLRHGTKMAENYEMHVAENGVWSARSHDGVSHVQSYEKIGYHTLAEKVLEGFLLGGGVCYFHGFDGITGQVRL